MGPEFCVQVGGERALDGDRLLEEAERAVLQAAALLVEPRDHVDRDVPRARIALERIEHGQARAIRQQLLLRRQFS